MRDAMVRQASMPSIYIHKHDVELRVSKANFKVKTSTGTKQILTDLNLTAHGGEMWALMGPSGAGKTTFLELMTLELRGGEPSGSVKLDGERLDFNHFRQDAVYVEQYDTHWGYLTCREIMEYAADLYHPRDKIEQKSQIERVMSQLGLLECADTIAGNQFVKGMSGGQRKRLTLGVACLKGPSLMLLDEPTSGLDAASAASVTTYLAKLAKDCNMIVIATIHQPSTEVFLGFDKVFFLANGREAYSGPTAGVAAYCSYVGHPLPAMTNPADYFLQLVNSEFVGREQVDRIVSMRAGAPRIDSARRPWIPDLETPLSESGSSDDEELRHQVTLCEKVRSYCQQTWTLLRRASVVSVRDPSLYIGRMLAFLIANSFFAVVYIKARTLDQQYVDPRVRLLIWFIAVPSIFSVVVVFASNDEFKLLRMEIKNGMTHSSAFLTATLLLQIPYMLLMAACSLIVPWTIAAYPMESLPMAILVVATMLWTFESLAQAFGVAFKNGTVGMLAMVGLWFCCFLFMGVFLNEEYIDWPFRALVPMLPLSWTVKAISYLGIHPSLFNNAKLDPTAPGGYVCHDQSNPFAPCYGRTGEQVLRNFHLVMSSVCYEDHVWQCIGILLIIGMVGKLLQISLIIYNTRDAPKVRRCNGKDGVVIDEDDDDASESES